MHAPIIVSEGTLRTQDLLPAFLDALRTQAPAHYAHYTHYAQPSYIPAYAMEDEDSDWWNSDEAYDKLAELTDSLNEHAPAHTFFGAHPGDGACFGFWCFDEED